MMKSGIFQSAFVKARGWVWARRKPAGAVPRWLDWPKWLTFGLIAVLFFTMASARLDPDFGWHLREGRELIAGTYDGGHYAFTADDYDYATHEWLSDVALAGIYDFGGYYALAVFYTALFVLAFWLIGRRRLGLVVFSAFLITLPFIGVRTVVYSALGLAVVMAITQARSRTRWRWLLPIVIWLWAQLHGSFMIGLAYLVFQAIFVDKSWRLVALAGAGGLLVLINPFGLELYREIFATTLDSSLKFYINEWRMGAADYALIVPMILLWGLSFAHLKIKKWRDLLQLIRFDNVMLLAAFNAVRQWPLFALSAIDTADQTLRKIVAGITWRELKTSGKIIVSSLALAFLGGLGFLTVQNYSWLAGYSLFNFDRMEQDNYPARSVEYLRANGCAGNLFNFYDFGGYLDWRLPEIRTYIDGRMPSWVSPNGEKYMETYHKTLHEPEMRAQEFARWNITCVLLPQNENMDIYKELDGAPDVWEKVVQDDGGNTALFIKRKM
jgi:hypothetical protein